MSGIKTMFGEVNIPQAPVQAPVAKTEEPVKLSRYMKNKLEAQKLSAHIKAKQVARKQARTASKPGGKLSQKALKVAQHKLAVKQILKSKQEPEKGGKSLFGVCARCGKPLTRPSSISQGLGDFCAHQGTLLPAGVTREQHIGSLTVTELPKGYIKLGEGYHAAREAGYSGSRFMQACGGNGGLRPALNEHFKFVFYKGTRYVPATCLKHLKDLEKR